MPTWRARAIAALGAAVTALRGDVTSVNPLARRYGGGRSYGGVYTPGGLGQRGIDRETGTFWQIGNDDLGQDPVLLRWLYRFEPIARRIVVKPTRVAASKGARPSVEGAPPELVAQLVAAWKMYDVVEVAARARREARLHGGALICQQIDAFETSPATVGRYATPWAGEDVSRLRVVARPEATASTALGRDGKPLYWEIRPPGATRSFRMDASRVVQLDGLDVDDETRRYNRGWGDPVLNPVNRALRRYNTSLGEMVNAQADSSIRLMTMPGWNDMVRDGKSGGVQQMVRDQIWLMGVLKTMIVDREGDLKPVSIDLKGMIDIHAGLAADLCATADLPATELFGTPPAGLSSDDASGYRKWLDRVDAEERPVIAEALIKVTPWLGVQLGEGLEVSVVWPRLWQESPAEAAAARKTLAEMDAIYAGLIPHLARQLVQARYADDPAPVDLEQLAQEYDQGDTGIDPLELLQQLRLAYPSGVLNDPDFGPQLLASVGLDVPGDASREFLLELLGRVPVDGAPNGDAEPPALPAPSDPPPSGGEP